jgi:hypothetical protein
MLLGGRPSIDERLVLKVELKSSQVTSIADFANF